MDANRRERKTNREWTRIGANKNLLAQRDIGGTNGEKCRAPHLRTSAFICSSFFIRVYSRPFAVGLGFFAPIRVLFIRVHFRLVFFLLHTFSASLHSFLPPFTS